VRGGICTKQGKYRDMEEEEVGDVSVSSGSTYSGVAFFLFFSFRRTRAILRFFRSLHMYVL
jgi:hypothetical protein